MDDSTTMPKRQQGGTEQDLKDAENAMVAAGHPDIALAMRRHSEAVRNMMIGVLIPSFETVMGPLLDSKLGTHHAAIEGLVREVQTEQRMFQQAMTDRMNALEARQARHEQATAVDILDRDRRLAAMSAIDQLAPYVDELKAIAERERRGDG